MLNEELRLDINYVNNYQKIDIFVKDNTIISFIDIKIYLDIPEKKILIKKYRLNPRNSLEDKNKYEIFWNGDSIQKEIFESEDRFKLEIEAIDIAGNQSIIISQFKNDLFFRSNQMYDYYTNIPLMHLLDSQLNLTENGKKILDKLYKEYKYLNKKNIYFRVHYHFDDEDDINLEKSEIIADKIYKYLLKDFDPSILFYRGVGKLYPIKNYDSELANYRNNRLEIILTNDKIEKNL